MVSCFIPPRKMCATARTDMGAPIAGMPRPGAGNHVDWIPYKDLNLMGVESIAWILGSQQGLPGLRHVHGLLEFPRRHSTLLGQGHTSSASNCPSSSAATKPSWQGERMAVDPNDGRHSLPGTRHSGLWKSTDGAATWNKVDSFPPMS